MVYRTASRPARDASFIIRNLCNFGSQMTCEGLEARLLEHVDPRSSDRLISRVGQQDSVKLSVHPWDRSELDDTFQALPMLSQLDGNGWSQTRVRRAVVIYKLYIISRDSSENFWKWLYSHFEASTSVDGL